MSAKIMSVFAAFALIFASASCGGGSSSGNIVPPSAISWQKVSVPAGATGIEFFAVNSSNHWFLSDRTKGFFRSTDQGATWTAINSGLATTMGWTINVNPANGDLIASTFSMTLNNPNTPVNFYRSTNEGASWTPISTVHMSAATALTGCAFAGNGNIVCGGYWAPNPNTGGWISTNGGQTATGFSTAAAMGSSVFSLAVNPVSGDLWLGTEQMGVFRSTDNGLTWTQASPSDQIVDPVNGIRDGNVFGITFDANGDVLFGSQGGIWKSTPQGSGFSWSNVLTNSNTSAGLGLARTASGELFYGHNVDPTNTTSVECSTDGGGTWAACDSGIPHGLSGNEFVVNPADGKLYAVIIDENAETGALYRTTSAMQ